MFKTSNGKYVAPSAIDATFKGICPYVSQLVIDGEGRSYCVALIALDADAIHAWANENGMGERPVRRGRAIRQVPGHHAEPTSTG